VTVLEGAELETLLRRFLWHSRRAQRTHDKAIPLIFAVCAAYKSVHGHEAINQALGELEAGKLTSPDARKLDLLFRGIVEMLVPKAHRKDPWYRELPTRSVLEALNEAVVLRPNLFGIGLDFNAIFRRVLARDH